jgi:hypothetical protein
MDNRPPGGLGGKDGLVPAPPSLELLADVVSAELDAQERRGDAIDSKAGVILGFAGVLVGLTASHVHNAVGQAGFASAAASAVLAVGTFMPRPFPALDPYQLRMRYLTEAPETTKQRLMDTRVSLYRQIEGVLRWKVRLVTAAVVMLASSIVLTGLGATL